MAVIGNLDYSTYHQIKDQPVSEANGRKNVRILNGEEYENVFCTKSFVLSSSSSVDITPNDIVDFRVLQLDAPNNMVSLKNISYIEYGDNTMAEFTWTLPNGTIVYNDDIENHDFAEGEVVSVDYGNLTNGYVNEDIIVTRSCGNLNDYMEVETSGNSFLLTVDQPNSGYQVVWSFSNGSPTQNGDAIIYNPPSSFTGNVTATVTFYRIDGSVACSGEITFSVDPDCKLRGQKEDEQVFPIAGKDYKIVLKIWVDHWVGTYGKVGSHTKTFRKGFLGLWYNYKVDEIRNDIIGEYWNQPDDVCIVITLNSNQENEFDSDDVGRHIEDNDDKVYFIDGELYTTGDFVENGNTYKYTKNGGKLFLTD